MRNGYPEQIELLKKALNQFFLIFYFRMRDSISLFYNLVIDLSALCVCVCVVGLIVFVK